MKLNKFILALAAALAIVSGLAGCGSRSSATTQSGKSLNVVASVDFYGEAAKSVLGDHGHVTSIIDNPNIDPHDYEPASNVGKEVAKADVIVENGDGYDSWMNRLRNGSGAKTITVSAANVVGVKNGENEHIWYKPQTMPKMANALAKAFGKLDPAHRTDYQKNAKAYIASLQPMMKLINKLKANAKGKEVAVSEPVFVNALNYLGYKVTDAHFAKAIEDSSDPSTADMRHLQADIKQKRIEFFVQNTQVQSKIVNHLVAQCKQAGVPVLKVTETLPAHKSYTSWMMSQYKALEKIQKVNQ